MKGRRLQKQEREIIQHIAKIFSFLEQPDDPQEAYDQFPDPVFSRRKKLSEQHTGTGSPSRSSTHSRSSSLKKPRKTAKILNNRNEKRSSSESRIKQKPKYTPEEGNITKKFELFQKSKMLEDSLRIMRLRQCLNKWNHVLLKILIQAQKEQSKSPKSSPLKPIRKKRRTHNKETQFVQATPEYSSNHSETLIKFSSTSSEEDSQPYRGITDAVAAIPNSIVEDAFSSEDIIFESSSSSVVLPNDYYFRRWLCETRARQTERYTIDTSLGYALEKKRKGEIFKDLDRNDPLNHKVLITGKEKEEIKRKNELEKQKAEEERIRKEEEERRSAAEEAERRKKEEEKMRLENERKKKEEQEKKAKAEEERKRKEAEAEKLRKEKEEKEKAKREAEAKKAQKEKNEKEKREAEEKKRKEKEAADLKKKEEEERRKAYEARKQKEAEEKKRLEAEEQKNKEEEERKRKEAEAKTKAKEEQREREEEQRRKEEEQRRKEEEQRRKEEEQRKKEEEQRKKEEEQRKKEEEERRRKEEEEAEKKREEEEAERKRMEEEKESSDESISFSDSFDDISNNSDDDNTKAEEQKEEPEPAEEEKPNDDTSDDFEEVEISDEDERIEEVRSSDESDEQINEDNSLSDDNDFIDISNNSSDEVENDSANPEPENDKESSEEVLDFRDDSSSDNESSEALEKAESFVLERKPTLFKPIPRIQLQPMALKVPPKKPASLPPMPGPNAPETDILKYVRMIITEDVWESIQEAERTNSMKPFIEIPESVQRPWNFTAEYCDMVIDVLNELSDGTNVTGMSCDEFINYVCSFFVDEPTTNEEIISFITNDISSTMKIEYVNTMYNIADNLLASLVSDTI